MFVREKVDFLQSCLQILQSDDLFLAILEGGVVTRFGKHACSINRLDDLIEGDAAIWTTVDVTSIKIVVCLANAVFKKTLVNKCAQNVLLKLAFRQYHLVVVLDLLGEVFAHLLCLCERSLSLALILNNPVVLQELFSRSALGRVRLKALDQEVSLVFIEYFRILHTIDNAFWIERVVALLAVHRQAVRPHDKGQDAQAPDVSGCRHLRFTSCIDWRVRDFRRDIGLGPGLLRLEDGVNFGAGNACIVEISDHELVAAKWSQEHLYVLKVQISMHDTIFVSFLKCGEDIERAG